MKRPPAPSHRAAPPPPGLVRADPWLAPFADVIRRRMDHVAAVEARLTGGRPLADVALGHLYFGLHRDAGGWVLREWAPNATDIYVVGECNGWREADAYRLARVGDGGVWEWRADGGALVPGQRFRLSVHWPGGQATRIPSYAVDVRQDPATRGSTPWCGCPTTSGGTQFGTRRRSRS